MGFSAVITDHTELTSKEASGVIDHADGSVTNAKIADGTINLVAKAEEVTPAHHILIPSSNFGRPPTNPPIVDVYGICHVLEFTVDTDKAYYKLHIPDDWVPGTPILVHTHWTRSTTGSDESGKTVKWQMKYLSVNGISENINSGEATLSVQDTYDSASSTDQIVYQTDGATIPVAAIAAGDCIVVELMAITPTGTALSEPAAAAVGITYTAYQVARP